MNRPKTNWETNAAVRALTSRAWVACALSAVGVAVLGVSVFGERSTAVLVCGWLCCAGGLTLSASGVRRIADAARPVLAIGSALRAFEGGERRLSLLRVDQHRGEIGQRWNRLIDEFSNHHDQETLRAIESALDQGDRGSGVAGTIVGSFPLGILYVDSFGLISEVNPAAAMALARSRDDLAQTEMAAQGLPTPLVEAATMVRERRSASRTLDYEGPGGTAYAVRVVAVGKGGEQRGALLIFEDVTQRQRADEIRDQFVSNTAHELRTPLTNIRLYVEEAIDAGTDSPEIVSGSLNVIQTEVRRLQRVVSDMLSVSEMESGSLSVHPRESKVEMMFRDLEHDFRPAAEKAGLEFAVELPPKFYLAVVDRERLTLALQNLIGNAIKYTDEGGSVRVRVESGEDALRVEVSDTGIGIAETEHDQVFERFVRSSDERAAARVGSGLGLCIAREIARLHGGDITLQSSLGSGSTFTLTVPTCDAGRAAA